MEGGESPRPDNLLKRILNKLTRQQPLEQPEFVPLPQPEKAEELEKFIQQGLELIKSKRYPSAIRHFDNPEETEKLGIYYAPDATDIFIDKLPISSEEWSKKENEAAKHCHFKRPKHEGEKPMIKLSHIIFDLDLKDPEGPFSLAGENLPKSLALQIPTSLSNNVALNYAEEWLHALQFFKGGQPIAGYKNTEIDVAAYLSNQGITLTDEFLARYQRRQVPF